MTSKKPTSNTAFTFYEKIKKWIINHKGEFLLLFIVLTIASYCRLYKIDQYLTFLGDEGRDAIIVRRLLVNFDPILIGPGTSIGNMYLGPLYYYLMAPALFLANYSPVGPAVMVALLGIATVFLVWYISREWFGRMAAFIAALLYATAPIVIIYSKSSWNPNIMPFFALVCIYAIWRVWRKFEFKWLIIMGISYAFVLQSHYLGLLLAPVLGLFYILTVIKLRDPSNGLQVKTLTKNAYFVSLLKYSVVGLSIFLLLMSPLVIFDARHDWRNFSAIKTFFTIRQETVSIKPWSALPKMGDLINKISTRLLAATDASATKVTVVGFTLGLLIVMFFYFKKLSKEAKMAYALLLVWIGVAFVGLGSYKQEIYDHYYGFFFPAPFMLIGGILQTIRNRHKFCGTLIALVTVTLFTYLNLKLSPLKNNPNMQMQRSIAVTEKMVEEASGKPFNIAVIAERNYEGAYQYFLEKNSAKVIQIDPQRYKETITDQLFVVCELPIDKCDPTHNSKSEIANFGWSKITNKWEIAGVILYKLEHNI